MLLWAGGALLAASTPSSAQREPRDGACFYEDADYGGRHFCARAGEDLRTIPSGLDDRISSIRVFGDAEVTVYRDSGYDGSSKRLGDDVRNLRNDDWNDRISSLEVRHRSSRSGDHRSSGRYQGDPDRIVRRAYEDILEREPDAAGLRLYRSRMIEDGWSEQDVREALRKSPEYRTKNTMTRQKAEEIVRHAYLAVLKREPDSGSRSYVDRVMRDKWTQADVERELRKSPEYRSR
jgi:hypothetical protein